MKVGIIGFGFVGKALANGLNNSDIFKVDPKLGKSIDDLINFMPEIVFVCLPTPMLDDGNQDINLILSTIKKLDETQFDGLIVIKSTVLPNHIDELMKCSKNIVINPEFLREKTADEDFVNSDLIVFGGKSENCKKLSNFYTNNTNCINKEHIHTDPTTASLIKYTINSFLSTKVVFFNELKNIFNASNNSETWKNFIDYVSRDRRIGNSHMEVPGPDGRFGYGGACFPKDTNALLKYSQEIQNEFNLLKNVISINNQIRDGYNEPTEREKEQNINFKTKGEK
tara:strand:- start:17991 stop:18839 length:849 start_codon:yes stop_codon:yes gene_type:complete